MKEKHLTICKRSHDQCHKFNKLISDLEIVQNMKYVLFILSHNIYVTFLKVQKLYFLFILDFQSQIQNCFLIFPLQFTWTVTGALGSFQGGECCHWTPQTHAHCCSGCWEGNHWCWLWNYRNLQVCLLKFWNQWICSLANTHTVSLILCLNVWSLNWWLWTCVFW